MSYWEQLGFQKLLWKTNIWAFQKLPRIFSRPKFNIYTVDLIILQCYYDEFPGLQYYYSHYQHIILILILLYNLYSTESIADSIEDLYLFGS